MQRFVSHLEACAGLQGLSQFRPLPTGALGSRSPWAPLGRSSLVMHVTIGTQNPLVIPYARNNALSGVDRLSAPGPLGSPALGRPLLARHGHGTTYG